MCGTPRSRDGAGEGETGTDTRTGTARSPGRQGVRHRRGGEPGGLGKPFEKGQGGCSELSPPVSPLGMGTAAFALRELERLGQGSFWHQGASFQGTRRESFKTFS